MSILKKYIMGGATICMLMCSLGHINAQEQEEMNYYIAVPDLRCLPSIDRKGDLQFDNDTLNDIFRYSKKTRFVKAFDNVKDTLLRMTYKISTTDYELYEKLLNKGKKFFPLVAEINTKKELTFTPNDWTQTDGRPDHNGKSTGLELINAQAAWDVTTGDPNIIIGITDTEFDLTHPDLAGQVVHKYGSDNSQEHGTGVAGFVAAKTNNNTGVPGIAHNCKLLVDTQWGNDARLLFLSQKGARVLNASWVNNCSTNPFDQSIYNEINTNGTVMVASAANNTTALQCYFLTAKVYPASYNNVISVSTVGHFHDYGFDDPVYGKNNWKDVHTYLADDPNTGYHRNDAVDICAPGYNVLGLKKGGGVEFKWGTSFSSPMVAGVCGLILSVNPCLTPAEVTDIIKSTAFNIYSIAENQPFAGMLGAGRIDAAAAVTKANTNLTMNKTANILLQNQTLSTTSFIASTKNIFVGSNVGGSGGTGNYTVQSGANVTMRAGTSVNLKPGFRAAAGSNFKAQVYAPCAAYGVPVSYRQGIEDFETNETINHWTTTAYPNPFTNNTFINLSLKKDAIVTVQVFNILGDPVKTLLENESLTSGEHHIPFSKESLLAGIYIAKVMVNGEQKSIKLILQNK